MPIGCYAAVPALADALLRQRPRTVLDLGIGFGGGGAAVREWLDLGVQPWRTYLVGVEAWAEYRNPVWDLYDAIYVRTIESFLNDNHEQFELVLFNDVLEHFDKAAGAAVLAAIRPHVARHGGLLVATPAHFTPQAAVYGNEWERHRSVWSASELVDLGFQVTRHGDPRDFCGECLVAQWRAP